jgi:hypothetical protein
MAKKKNDGLVPWHFSLTDFPPTCWVALAFLPVSQSLTLPFPRDVAIRTTATFLSSGFDFPHVFLVTISQYLQSLVEIEVKRGDFVV